MGDKCTCMERFIEGVVSGYLAELKASSSNSVITDLQFKANVIGLTCRT